MTDICPQCKTNFDLIHKRCVSMRFAKYLQNKMDELWIGIGKSNLKVDRLEDQIEALQEENVKLRLRKNGVEIDSVKDALESGQSLGLSPKEVKAYMAKSHDIIEDHGPLG